MFKKILILHFLIALVWAKDSLGPNECLAPGEFLTSSNGCFKLILQGDGNLVIYRQSNGKATWSSKHREHVQIEPACKEMETL